MLLIQPGGRVPGFATVGAAGTKGRSLFAFDAEYEEMVPVEFRIEVRPVVRTGDTGPYFLNFGQGAGFAYLSPDGLEGRFGWDAV